MKNMWRRFAVLAGLIVLGLSHVAVAGNNAREMIRLTGYLDRSAADEDSRSSLQIAATKAKISVELHRRVRGTKKSKVEEIDAAFQIVDPDFVRDWRSLALAVYAQENMRPPRAAEPHLANGFLVILPEGITEKTISEVQGRPSGDIGAYRLVVTMLEKLDWLLGRKEYQELKVLLSEGDIVPAVIVDVEELLAAPDRWNGKRVRISGWASFGFEESELQPSRLSDWLYRQRFPGLGSQGIWIGDDSTVARGWGKIQPRQTGPRELEGIVRAGGDGRGYGHLGGYRCMVDRLTVNRRLQ